MASKFLFLTQTDTCKVFEQWLNEKYLRQDEEVKVEKVKLHTGDHGSMMGANHFEIHYQETENG